jgi:hypothetical protein
MDRIDFIKTLGTLGAGMFGGAAFLSSCNKLNVAPLNIVNDADIFSNENGVTAYLASIYATLPIEDFIYEPNNGFMTNDGGRWQCFYQTGALDGELVGPYGGTGDGAQGFGFWPYDHIRTANYMLETLPKYKNAFTPQQVNQWMGEAYFCRAYFYFALAKRYGGVPIVKTVQNYPDQSISELQVPRNKEEDVWDFIGSDFDNAYSMLPGTSDRSRANKYVAVAYKSRAMLYAGTIAKYGSQNFVAGEAQQKGFVGIPVSSATKFFQAAYDAAKLVEGNYSLYENEISDKVQNYVDLFLDQNSPENIFVRDYSIASGTAHSWDATMTCRYMTADGLSRSYPTLDFVERWGSLSSAITNPDGTPIRFTDRANIINGLEPRLLATVYFPGDTLRGLTFDIQRGIYKSFSGDAVSELNDNLTSPNDGPDNLILSGSTDQTYNGKRVIGLCGISTNGDDLTRTGFYVRKYINYKAPQSACGLYQSTQSWIDMRYAEVLLNRAEAALELGTSDMKTDALNALNQLRARAGGNQELMSTLTIDTVRNERAKELAFEHHYWWDIRRWRIADQILDNSKFYGLLPYYVADEDKYIFLKQIETFQRVYTFDKRWYYEPLPGGELGKNPNLYPNNPGY